MKFWKNTQTGQLVRLGDWEKIFETVYAVNYVESIMQQKLHQLIRNMVAHGDYEFLGDMY